MNDLKFLANKNILIARTQSWYSPIISKQFVTLELARQRNRVTYVSLHRIIKDIFYNEKLNKFKFHEIKPDNVKIKTLKVSPGFLRHKILYWITVQNILSTLESKYRPDIIISFSPIFYILHTIFPDTLKIYYCTDHLGNNQVMAEAEKEILDRSDIVVAASKRLYDDLNVKHSNVNYLPHGVNLLEEYQDRCLKNRIDRWFVDKKNRVVFGFVGYISNNIDFSLIDYIARKNPENIIALIGLQEPGVANKLNQLPANVFCPGPVPTIGLKYCLSHFDVGIVPYVRSRYISRTNPVKIMEYIASGLPVVTTEVGEDFTDSSFVIQCTDIEEFNLQMKLAKNNSSDLIYKRIQYGKENTWKKRIKLFDEILGRFWKE